MPINFNVRDNMLHKEPMILVDSILEESAKTASVSFNIKQDCIFVDERFVFSRSAFIEIIAQSFAAVDVYQKQRDKGKKSKGFLVGVRDFQIYGDAFVGDELICRLERMDEVGGLNICKAQILKGAQNSNGQALLAQGELRIFETPF